MQKLKVMIADDEVTIIEGLKKLIPWEKCGYSVCCVATDGISAINLAREHRPDMVIMDVNMPLCSGLEAIEMLTSEMPDTVFVILSGYDDFEYARKALKFNVYEYLLKPVKIDKFIKTINDLKIELMKKKLNVKSKKSVEIEDSLVNRIVSYITMNLSSDITLKRLACEFHMNPTYLSQLFKNETGVNYHTYLNQQRINKAKILLVKTDLSISQIAIDVGFNDYRVFTKAFKQSERINPSGYRKRYKESD